MSVCFFFSLQAPSLSPSLSSATLYQESKLNDWSKYYFNQKRSGVIFFEQRAVLCFFPCYLYSQFRVFLLWEMHYLCKTNIAFSNFSVNGEEWKQNKVLLILKNCLNLVTPSLNGFQSQNILHMVNNRLGQLLFPQSPCQTTNPRARIVLSSHGWSSSIIEVLLSSHMGLLEQYTYFQVV